MDSAIVIALVGLAVVMFASERVPLEVGALAIVLLLALTGVLSPQEAFAGFANGTVIFIFSLLSMTQALTSTGVMQIVGRRADFVGRLGERAFVGALMVLVSAFSSIASNTAVTAALLPVSVAAAARAQIPTSRVLMPMAHASMLGGTILLFGTSTNLVVSEAMKSFGMRAIGFSELAQVGLPLTALGIVWTVLVGRRLLPDRAAPQRDAPLSHREYVTEAVITERSRFLGRRLAAVSEGLGLPVLGVVRDDRWIGADPEERLAPGDRLVLRGTQSTVLHVKSLRSMVLRAELELPDRAQRAGREVLFEALVPEHSPLVGASIAEARLPDRYGVRPLAIHRHPSLEGLRRPSLLSPVREGQPFRSVVLASGDVLLLSGPRARVDDLADGRLLLVLGEVPYRRPRYGRAVVALAIFVTAVALAATDVVPPPLAGIAGMLAMIVSGCVESGTAFRVEWQVVLLIGSLLALGQAVEKSGTGNLIAQSLLSVAGGGNPHLLLLLVMAITVVLSIPMSNQAAALVMLPVAIHLAELVGVDARTFAMGTCLAASCSFATPLEPSAALVFGPGHYRFADYVRAGAPLTALALLVLTFAVPLAWPF